ncbi:MAG: restriction endonuclease [Anaerolineae bacterium]|jgi:restriction system protein|nr:restriction endonuclease [Anaerolineae bacterium]
MNSPSIPAYHQLMLPILQLTGDGQHHKLADMIITLADYLGLDAAQRAELSANGTQLKFNHRVQYAAASLRKAGLIQAITRGTYRITAQGLQVLGTQPLHIDRAFLMQFPMFAESVRRERHLDADSTDLIEQEHTPKELIHILYTGIQKELADDLIDTILGASPAFFEKLVVDLLVTMGYGRGGRLGRSGDGGVDGVVQEDKLGLDVVYVQAKRYQRTQTIGRPAVQGFIGSLIGQGAQRGVMITTSRFSKEAIDYARSMQNHKVILIDGARLTALMLEHGVGVSLEAAYLLYKIDRDYFEID